MPKKKQDLASAPAEATENTGNVTEKRRRKADPETQPARAATRAKTSTRAKRPPESQDDPTSTPSKKSTSRRGKQPPAEQPAEPEPAAAPANISADGGRDSEQGQPPANRKPRAPRGAGKRRAEATSVGAEPAGEPVATDTAAAVDVAAPSSPEVPQGRSRRQTKSKPKTPAVTVLSTQDRPNDEMAEAHTQAPAAPAASLETAAPGAARKPARASRKGSKATAAVTDTNADTDAAPSASDAPAGAPEPARDELTSAPVEAPASEPAVDAPATRGKRSRKAPSAAARQPAGPAGEPRETAAAASGHTPTDDTVTVAAEPETVRSERPSRRSGRKPKAQAAPAVEPPAAQESTPTRKSRKTKSDAPTRRAKPDRPSEPDAPVRPDVAADVARTAAHATEDAAGAEVATDDRAAHDVLLELLRKAGRPVHVRDVERQLTRRDREKLGDRREMERALEHLAETGDVVRTRRRTYGLPAAMNLVRGRFQASSGGFGFVIPETGGEDYYIPPEATLEAWNGDTVLVRPEGVRDRKGDSPRATVVRILQRAHGRLVGTLEHSRGYALLKADDTRARHRILLMPEGTEDVKAGSRVLAELFWPETTGEDEVFGRVTRVLGETDDPETETQAVVVKYGLRDEFPAAVMAEAEAIPTQVPAEALQDRLDLREANIFTVDGRDAKDFDDAIHIQPTADGSFVIGVHIADVSHYVRAGTALDAEAYARATSVYLPGRVLPMLPERLSNGVCSLVPHEDRLTLSAMIEVNADGDVLSVQLAPSVIRSQARLTYDEVQAYSEGVASLPEHARKIEGDLHLLLKLTSRMRQRRLRAGSLDFKLREVKVDVDRDGNLQLIPIREETARGMIEDLMLLANKVVAQHMLEQNAPALYRVHEEPTQGRFAEVSAALARMGIPLGNDPTPQAYQEALKKVRGTPQETVVNTLLLRSLKQARYTGENLGHFGLAFEEYLHFTSPIRRYPDLIVHRALRASLAGEGRSRAMDELRQALPAMGEHTSERERSAAEAERDLTKYYQAKWAQAHLGEVFDGVVSGVTSFGVFVALDNGVEGLLHISNLDDDYYVFIEEALMLKGRSTGHTYRMGDALTVKIAQVNPLGRNIDFTQENEMDDSGVKPRARRRGERDQTRGERDARTTDRPRSAVTEDTQRQDATPPRDSERERGRGRDRDRERGRGRGQVGERLAPPPARTQGVAGGAGKRRIVTLERSRNEHNRPIAVTVQRMYFGDWSVENLREDEPQGGGGGRRGGGRPQPQQPAQQSAPPASQGGQADANRRRRRRRGRRSNGTGGSGSE